ncbi:NlpC/P60 family protein [Streptomyces sp. NPDC002685]|uniref:C40 family peptidase n=1 Tax=Streptomyces sp. NPDC002685 TaxID=3154540 RepID=UPI0033343247
MAPERTPPSGEEVRRRLSSLYDQAENATGNFNATRALANVSRKPARQTVGEGRGEADPAQADLMRQWFDGARSRLGPSVPAVLPADRQPAARPTEGARPPKERPAELPAARQLEQSSRPVAELTAAPVRELTAGPVPELTARPVLELTAGPVAELTAGPAPVAPGPGTPVRAALPEGSAPAAASQRSPLQLKKDSARRKLAAAQELLSRHNARQSMPVVQMPVVQAPAIEYRPVEEPRLTSFESVPLPPWYESAPLPASFEPVSLPPVFESAPLPTSFEPAPLPPAFEAAPLAASFEPVPLPVDTAWRQSWPAGSDQSWSAAPGPVDPNPGFSIDSLVGAGAPPVVGYDTRAAEAVAFARAQVGRPCVWGASGPGSYDPSGLTQAAWKSAGVLLPRATYDQAQVGPAIALTGIQPGDLVFFHSNVSHVGLYIGDGMMVHAPSPGARIAEESIHTVGQAAIHSVVRPT